MLFYTESLTVSVQYRTRYSNQSDIDEAVKERLTEPLGVSRPPALDLAGI